MRHIRSYTILTLFLAVSLSLHAAKPITVADLTKLVQSDIDNKKSDDTIAGELIGLELSEQFVAPAYNSLLALNPGPRTIEQLTVLLYSSAFKPLPNPPVIDTPAPDEAAQKAIFEKLTTYSATFAQLPNLTANKTIMRFDNASGSRTQDYRLSAGNGSTTPNMLSASVGSFLRYRGATTTAVQIVRGTESLAKGKPPVNDPQGPIFTEQFGSLLPLVVQESAGNGSLHWQRWDRINNLEVAVFSFAVEKKKSHYQISYCCFAEYDIKGRAGVTPLQSTADWKPFKSVEPYHGLLYVEPRTGAVLRLVLQTDFKASDNVTREDTRVDYASAEMGAKSWIVPREQTTVTSVVNSGENSGHAYSQVRNIYSIRYDAYKAQP